ncbi:hypothetical protein Cni_G20469 [Canna indica]|uniref:Pentatricopeptide repeat-containing protein n=1 Tax=Canna indica TaxID=4628 RepID=A0AAQ3KP57_9LILI|nr:hypothetical protein Cni_G20469 [Canna indica]
MGFVYHFSPLVKAENLRKFMSFRTVVSNPGLVAIFVDHFHNFGGAVENLDLEPTRKEMCQDNDQQSSVGRTRITMDFRSSKHDSTETEFIVEPVGDDETATSYGAISDEAERICKLLSNQPNSNINCRLDKAGVSVSPILVAEVLKKLSNAGLLAYIFFRWAEKQKGFLHTTEIYHHLIETLGKIKQFRLIWSLVEFMKHRGLMNRETFAVIIRRYARARQIKEAIDTFEKMELFGLKPELSDYNCLIDTICKSRNVQRAQEICNEMKRRKRFAPDLKTYTILLRGWGDAHNLSSLKALFQDMLNEGFEPDVVTYGILINAFCKSQMCDDAIKIFHEMESKNCNPSPHIYCSLINGLGSEKRLDDALKYFELFKASGFPPETPTYNALVGSYCWVTRFEDAFRVMDEMKRFGIGPNSRTYDIIINHFIKAGKTEEAYEIFQSMGREVDCEPMLNTYTMMVCMFCNVERVDMAIKVWNKMKDKGIPPCMHMFSALINGLCFENRLDDACRYFQEMLDKGIRPPGQLYSKLKETLLEAGRRDLAIDFGLKLEQLRKTSLVV